MKLVFFAISKNKFFYWSDFIPKFGTLKVVLLSTLNSGYLFIICFFYEMFPTVSILTFYCRASELSLYREGVVTDRPAKDGCCFVNIGLKAECLVKRTIKPG